MIIETITEHKCCFEGRQATVKFPVYQFSFAVFEFADKIVVMQDGRTVVSGSSDEVYNSGIINDVFDVDLRRIAEDDSVAYRFDRKLL